MNTSRIPIQSLTGKIGDQVRIAGWVHTHRNMGKMVFFNVRDASGVVQVVALSKPTDVFEHASQLNTEFVVEVQGIVNERPAKLKNPDMETGSIELLAEKITVLNPAKTTPFEINSEAKHISEELRYRYRYLDLRKPSVRKKIVFRSAFVTYIRTFLAGEGFIEIETPILGKSTPEGARDYLVPSRQFKGKFYALPQSPQQYKQLLMVAGFEKYFQVAPCFRDEDARADRAPDQFYQLDMEMAFTDQDEILALIERMFTSLVKDLLPEKHITTTPWPRLTYAEAMAKYHTDKPDLRKDPKDPNELAFCFVVDFPLFEPKLENGHYAPMHHIFTRPKEEDIALLDSDPLKVRSWQHDFVLNGIEVGGGSLRIYTRELQEHIFKLVGLDVEKAKVQFGHMLEAFEFGAPPHGGIAPGIDRLLMMLLNEDNVREVVAFPKSTDNRDLLMGAPSEVDDAQLKDLHIRLQ